MTTLRSLQRRHAMPIRFKKITNLIAVLVLTSVFAGCAGAPVKPEHITRGDYESTKQYLTQLIQYEMKKHDVTGLSIALVDDQQIVWAQGFGYADKTNNIAATPETVYRVGSISKLFTDTAVMQLAQEGKLDIDKPLQTYLPQFSIKTRFPNAGPITPRTIMTHHSGLPGNLAKGMWAENPEPFTNVVSAIKDEYVAYPPNFVWSYSNLGLTLLGHMVQQITREDFAFRLDQSVLRPLGMVHSSFSARPEAPGIAKAYRNGTQAVEPPLRDVPAGGLNSSVLDLSRFVAMVFANGQSNGHQILKPETLAEMLRPQNRDVALDQGFRVGLGWMLSGLGGINIENAGPVAHHGGATLLHRSQLITLPDHKLGVVVLSNSASGGSVVNDVATEALKLALEAKTGIQQPKRQTLETSASPLSKEDRQAYAGYYTTAFGFAKITSSGDRLRAEILGKRFDLVPRGGGQVGLQYKLLGIFPVKIEQLAEIGLSRANVSGREILLAHTRNQNLLVGEKIAPVPVSEKWMKRIGDYEIVNGEGDALVPMLKKISLRYRDGFLIMKLSMPEGSAMVPIAPISDTEAIFLGLGRGLGETIRVLTIDGEERAASSGYVLRKSSN
jgi:CubicO group peptidase (beta-lactamase class C family)